MSSSSLCLYCCIQKHQPTPLSLTNWREVKRIKLLCCLVRFIKAGKIIRGFSARDSREVVLRTPKWEGLDYLLELVNSLVEEMADIARTKKASKRRKLTGCLG